MKPMLPLQVALSFAVSATVLISCEKPFTINPSSKSTIQSSQSTSSSRNGLTEEVYTRIPKSTRLDGVEDPDISQGHSQPNTTIEIQEPFNPARPALLGLALRSAKDTAIDLYGKPTRQYTLEDAIEPMSMLDYKTFVLGYNKKNQLYVIDIRHSSILPGLNGLHLGASSTEIVKALGKPDASSTAVITYKVTGAILKFDLDPKADRITAIRLFVLE